MTSQFEESTQEKAGGGEDVDNCQQSGGMVDGHERRLAPFRIQCVFLLGYVDRVGTGHCHPERFVSIKDFNKAGTRDECGGNVKKACACLRREMAGNAEKGVCTQREALDTLAYRIIL